MIDWARVEELRQEVGGEDFHEIVQLFLEEVSHAVDDLGQAGGNPAVTAEQMHFLKGAALNLGFSDLSRLCREGETAAMKDAPDTVAPADVRRVFEESRAAFEADLPGRFVA